MKLYIRFVILSRLSLPIVVITYIYIWVPNFLLWQTLSHYDLIVISTSKGYNVSQ